MTLNKADIAKKVCLNINVTNNQAHQILNSFLFQIKKNSKLKIMKLSKFGSFEYKKTKERLGRNPKSKESYIIESRSKIIFKSSNILRKVIN